MLLLVLGTVHSLIYTYYRSLETRLNGRTRAGRGLLVYTHYNYQEKKEDIGGAYNRTYTHYIRTYWKIESKMLSFHRRNRSLIPVSDLEKSEKEMLLTEEEIYVEEDGQHMEIGAEELAYQTPAQRRNLTMIYLLFLAEAIMASSLSTQIMVLIPEATGCSSMNASFLRSVLECAYFFGSAAGMFWGPVADTWGRRKVALLGLAGMSTCCISMGFAKSLPAFMALRFVAGAISSGVTVAGLAMLADVTQGGSGRVKAVARLPVIAFGGSIGPFAANAMRKLGEDAKIDMFAKYPGLSAQAACGGLVLSIALAEMLLLREVSTVARLC